MTTLFLSVRLLYTPNIRECLVIQVIVILFVSDYCLAAKSGMRAGVSRLSKVGRNRGGNKRYGNRNDDPEGPWMELYPRQRHNGQSSECNEVCQYKLRLQQYFAF